MRNQIMPITFEIGPLSEIKSLFLGFGIVS